MSQYDDAIHNRVMKRLRAMTDEQRIQSLKDAGILTETGELHPNYKPKPNELSYRDPLPLVEKTKKVKMVEVPDVKMEDNPAEAHNMDNEMYRAAERAANAAFNYLEDFYLQEIDDRKELVRQTRMEFQQVLMTKLEVVLVRMIANPANWSDEQIEKFCK